MDLRHLICAVVVFLAVAINQGGEALQCHQCSSQIHAQCGDPFFYEPEKEGDEPQPKTLEFLKDCPEDGNEYTLCRKIYQNVRGVERIIRGCGYLEYKEDQECYKTVLEEYNTYVCTCKGDGCNGSTNLNVNLLAVTLPAIFSILYFKGH